MRKNVPARKEQLSVIVADDEPIIAMNLAEMLKDNGFRVIGIGQDGFEAISLCRKHHADVVLLDVKMPLVDGLTAAQTIFEEDLADTIIMVTAFSDEELVNKASNIGVAGYLVKPVDERSLLPCIKIGRARSEQLRLLKKKADEATEAMEARKVIERAKGIVMQDMNMTEQEAYCYIRQISKEKHISMKSVSEIIIKPLTTGNGHKKG